MKEQKPKRDFSTRKTKPITTSFSEEDLKILCALREKAHKSYAIAYVSDTDFIRAALRALNTASDYEFEKLINELEYLPRGRPKDIKKASRKKL